MYSLVSVVLGSEAEATISCEVTLSPVFRLCFCAKTLESIISESFAGSLPSMLKGNASALVGAWL